MGIRKYVGSRALTCHCFHWPAHLPGHHAPVGPASWLAPTLPVPTSDGKHVAKDGVTWMKMRHSFLEEFFDQSGYFPLPPDSEPSANKAGIPILHLPAAKRSYFVEECILEAQIELVYMLHISALGLSGS